MQAQHTADDEDVSRASPLHVGHDLFNHAHNTIEIGLEHLLHVIQTESLNGPHQTDASVIDYKHTDELWLKLKT